MVRSLGRVAAMLGGIAMLAACKPQTKNVVVPESIPATQKAEPVLIWAHYMPQITNAAIHFSFDGNNDAWPFNSQNASLVEEYKEHIRLAMGSGIGGFQMLCTVPPEMYEAARQIQDETGRVFYIAPEWCDTLKNDPVVAADAVAEFMKKHEGNPYLYLREGRPVFFTYFAGKWEKSAEGVAAFRARLAERGVNPLMIPTITDKMLLDRTDLGWRAWPEGELKLGPVEWLQLGWEGATTFDMETDPRAAAAMHERIQTEAPGFVFMPGFSAGYDNSNRPSQATRVPSRGVRALIDNFSMWRELGYRQFTYITWNDCNETLLVPSSHNVWGYNTILSYLKGRLEKGRSPLAQPEVVVAYPGECLYGDVLDFQVVGLPAGSESLAVKARVEWSPIGGGEPIVIEGESAKAGREGEVFLSLDWESGKGLGSIEGLQPRVTVWLKSGEGEWRVAYDRVILPPTHLSYNLLRMPTGYAIALNRISQQGSLELQATAGSLTEVVATASGLGAIRRLHLNDGSRSVGAFRESSAGGDKRLKNLFLRIETSTNVPLELRLSDGYVHDLFTRDTTPTFGTVAIDQENAARFPAFIDGKPWWRRGGWRAARVDVAPGAEVTLSVLGAPEGKVSAKLEELTKRRVTKTFDHQGQPVTISLGLTHDGTEANADYPLPGDGVYKRQLPLFLEFEGTRILYAMALLESGKIAVSNAVKVSPSEEDAVAVQWIETGGAFDDFVRNGYDKSYNPFTPEQVHTAALPRDQVPYFHLDFEEGAGPRLNDRSTEHQPGRAWLEYQRGASHAAGFDAEANGHYQWLAEGQKGGAIRLGAEEGIRFRSKSSPVGAETLSVWLQVSREASAGAGWRAFMGSPFSVKLRENGEAGLVFRKAEFETSFRLPAAFQEGWNHLVFVYDLGSVRVYLNGVEVGGKAEIPPLYQRTHRTPKFTFEEPVEKGLRFTGAVDELEVIGTAISSEEVSRLTRGEAWRKQP